MEDNPELPDYRVLHQSEFVIVQDTVEEIVQQDDTDHYAILQDLRNGTPTEQSETENEGSDKGEDNKKPPLKRSSRMRKPKNQ